MLTALNYFQTLACCPSRALGRLCLIQRAAGSNPRDNKSQERQIRVIESSMQWVFTGMEGVCYGNGAKLHVEMINEMGVKRGVYEYQ